MRKREGHIQEKGSDVERCGKEMQNAGCESTEKVVPYTTTTIGEVMLFVQT